MPSKFNALNLHRWTWIQHPNAHWVISGGLHALLAAAIAATLIQRVKKFEDVEISVVEAQAPKAVQIRAQVQPEKIQPKQPRAVFGLSRKSITDETSPSAPEVKAGNTLAKTPDNEKLRPEDADTLPVPAEEYLITAMPELAQEVRVPYPTEAKRKGAQGAVVMDLLIDQNGTVRDAKLVQGPEDSLNAAALEAVRGFAFRPARIQDKPVAVRIRYAYRFVLER